MQNVLLQAAPKLNKRRKHRQWWQRAVRTMAMVVVFCTTYALILPAITMEAQPACGVEAHAHTQDCYAEQQRTAFACALPEQASVVHTHDALCYEEDGTLSCPLAELSLHAHEDTCYGRTSEIICTNVHVHGENCQTTKQVLICQMPEGEAHSHSSQCQTQTVLSCSEKGHDHEDACYTVTEVVCPLEETPGHTHTEECYVQQEAPCELTTNDGHVHDDTCYAQSSELTCGKEECELHLHEAACCDAEGTLICTQPQVVVHQHTESCRTQSMEAVLICGLEEHTHADACYPAEEDEASSEYLCGQGIHTHVESCYDADGTLICTIPEHTHIAACLVKDLDLNAGVETAAQWDKAMEALTFTGNWNEDLLTVAKSQLGYAESAKNVVLSEDGTLNGYTRYGAKYGTPYAENWNTLFVRFCLEYAGITPEYVPHADTVAGWIDVLTQKNLYVSAMDASAAVGDIVFFDLDDDQAVDRAALLEELEIGLLGGTTLHTIEGIPGEGVVRQKYTSEDAQPVGFLDISAAFDAYQLSLIPTQPLEEGTYPVWMYTDETYTTLCSNLVTIQVSGELPEGAVVYAYPVELEMEQSVLCAFDISIFLADGSEYQPEQPLTVQFLSDFAGENLAVYHMTENGAEDVAFTADENGLTFEASGFSVYAVADITPMLSVAEPGSPEAMREMQESGFFEYWEQFIPEETQEKRTLVSYAKQFLVSVSDWVTRASNVQIDNWGGEVDTASTDSVYVSKTIEGTDIENVFDITLRVNTVTSIQELQKEPDMAVVVVMDISNTMTREFGSTTRYAAAVTAAEHFIDNFADENQGISRLGFVAFNTHAHEIFPLSVCSTDAQATSLKNSLRQKTGNIINAAGYANAWTRFTNIEAGLKRGWDMLKNAPNENKYIIFLSDGFPTTYIDSGYNGYDPNTSSGTIGANGTFYDSVQKKYCKYGTSYSDKAAIRARQMATQIKNAGATVFSIGIDIGGQTITNYVNQTANQAQDKDQFSVVDRTGTTYELGDPGSANSFKNWLGGSATDKTKGIGSGYYYDSTNLTGLEAAYNQIFAEIKKYNLETSQEKWVTYDPMPALENAAVHIDFLGFYDWRQNFGHRDTNGNIVSAYSSLTGNAVDAGLYPDTAENSATFDTSTQTIRWDLKNSAYYGIGTESSTYNVYQITYRVRLKNEDADFIENYVYNTNGTTKLNYQVVTTVNGVSQKSETKTVEFPIPAVHGFLGELSFQKIGPSGEAVPGVEFTLSHDTANCGLCRGDELTTVPNVGPFVQTSGLDGKVTFSDIPSGHHYILKETATPAEYVPTTNTYQVVVAYDATTVTVTDADGNPLEWSSTIMNGKLYVLPNTGSVGTTPYALGGLFLIAAALMYSCKCGRKQRKGGTQAR